MPKAFNAVFYRLTAFFMLGSLAVGILVPYDDAELTAAFASDLPGAAASPYVVAMNRLRISGLPHIVNALVLASAFSAGNSYVYCASRSLFGLALDGKAPRIFTRTTRRGVPIYCVLVVLLISLLSFLQVSNSASTVLSWFVNLVTASQLINYAVMCMTFISFYNACKAQGLDRNTLPYKGIGQPYIAWYGFTGCFIMAFVGGYAQYILDIVMELPMLTLHQIHRLPSWKLGCSNVLVQLLHDRSFPSLVCGVETAQKDKVEEAARR